MANVKDSMVCWNPGTDEVALIPWPDKAHLSDAFQSSYLACMSEIQAMTDPLELEIAAYTTTIRMIVRDGVDPAAAHKAMSELDEYQAWW